MKSLLFVAFAFLTFQAQASVEKTFVCQDGDYFITLKTSSSTNTISTGICSFSPCNQLSWVAQPRSSRIGGKVVYDVVMPAVLIEGQKNPALVVQYNQNGGIDFVEQYQETGTAQVGDQNLFPNQNFTCSPNL